MATTTLSNRELVIHDDVDPNGRQHLSATVTGDVSDSEGFPGRLTYTYGQNVEGPIIAGGGEFRGFILLGNTTLTSAGRQRQAAPGSRRLPRAHHLAGLTGELTGEVDIFKAECLGKAELALPTFPDAAPAPLRPKRGCLPGECGACDLVRSGSPPSGSTLTALGRTRTAPAVALTVRSGS